MTQDVLAAEPVRDSDSEAPRGIGREDIARYFSRIGYTGAADPTLDTLRAVMIAHERTIAFENLDPLMGVPVFDLSPAALFAKMVHRARGGYCYEHNNLLRYVLAELGYGTEALSARVVWMNPAGLTGPPPAQTHQLLAVRIPGDEQRYLVDVGFGGQSPTSPIRRVVGESQQTRHEPYRLRELGTGHVLEAQLRQDWQPLYTFTDESKQLIDLQVGSWYVSTHPASKFVTGLIASIITDDARWNLAGRNLTAHHRDGHSEHIRLDNAAAVLDVLMNRFGIDVGGLGDVHKRITEVLDS